LRDQHRPLNEPSDGLLLSNDTFAGAYLPRQHVLSRAIAEETVLLDLLSEQYYRLDPVGSRVWLALAGGETIEEIVRDLELIYYVNPAVLRHDVESLVRDLVAAQLVDPS
jgi:hypothetical protein